MKTIRITEVLVYYDGILSFTAQDAIGGNYIGSITDPEEGRDRYAVTGVRPERVVDLMAGKVDLRTLMLEAPDGEWHITVDDGPDGALTLVPQNTPLADTDHLPGEDFFMEPEGPEYRWEATARALERGDTVTDTGLLEQVNRSTGEWGLLSDDGVQTGMLHPGSPGLNGLQVGVRYRFDCVAVTKNGFLGERTRTLYLLQVQRA